MPTKFKHPDDLLGRSESAKFATLLSFICEVREEFSLTPHAMLPDKEPTDFDRSAVPGRKQNVGF